MENVTCVCVCVCIYIYLYIYLCVCVYLYLYISLSLCVCVSLSLCVCPLFLYLFSSLYWCVCLCVSLSPPVPLSFSFSLWFFLLPPLDCFSLLLSSSLLLSLPFEMFQNFEDQTLIQENISERRIVAKEEVTGRTGHLPAADLFIVEEPHAQND